MIGLNISITQLLKCNKKFENNSFVRNIFFPLAVHWWLPFSPLKDCDGSMWHKAIFFSRNARTKTKKAFHRHKKYFS